MKGALLAAVVPALGDIGQDNRNPPPDPDAFDTCFHPPLNQVLHNPWLRWPLHAHQLYAELMFESINSAPKDHYDVVYEIHPAALVGSFIWVTSNLEMTLLDKALEKMPCNETLGIVIQGVPTRACSLESDAFYAHHLDLWKEELIDAIAARVQKYSNRSIAIIVEPGHMEAHIMNTTTTNITDPIDGYILNITQTTCNVPSHLDILDNYIPYALRTLSMNNTMLYIDVGNGGTLGYGERPHSAAIAFNDIYEAAGRPASLRGIATNIASFNAWDANIGEFQCEDEIMCLPTIHNERLYVDVLQQHLERLRLPFQALIDTSRNGVPFVRRDGTAWCNPAGAGIGLRSQANIVRDSSVDGWAWIWNPGMSDGASFANAWGHEAACGRPEAVTPAPERGAWHTAYFESLVRNAVPMLGHKHWPDVGPEPLPVDEPYMSDWKCSRMGCKYTPAPVRIPMPRGPFMGSLVFPKKDQTVKPKDKLEIFP